MIRSCRGRFLLVIAATLGIAAPAWAEKIISVNENGTGSWVFDQPSVVANGTVLHVAFVGDNTAGADNPLLNTRLYYAAVNGAADFTAPAATRSQVLITNPVAIDNGDAYTGARHPQIALRSSTELAILFQAVPAGDNNYKLFLARVTIANNAVTSQNVREILDAAGVSIPRGLTDPSFALVTSDNTMRVAFSSSPSLRAPPSSDVYYARVALDNARVIDNTLILLTKTASSTGKMPLPRLRLDGANNSHVVWAANDNAVDTPSGIYYVMVKTVPPGVVDNLAIGATQVLSGGNRWGFPNVLLASTGGYIWVFAADDPFGSQGSPGSIGFALLNPYAVIPNGNPVNVNNSGTNALFFLNPPGESVLSPNFDAYHPEMSIDSLSRLHVAGYGFRSSLFPFLGTPGRYYAMTGGTIFGNDVASIFGIIVSSPVTVGLGDVAFAMQLSGDYTRPAFVHYSGKAVHFWSGPDDPLAGDAGARNLYVTSVFDSPDNSSTTQSGCSMVDDPRDGETGRIPGAAVLLLPAALLALRRAARKAFARA